MPSMDEIDRIDTQAAYEALRDEYKIVTEVADECLVLIWRSGLMDETSDKVKHYIGESRRVQELLATKGTPNLDLRVGMQEWHHHILKVFDVPASQTEFYLTIAKVCYIMMLAEKNPLFAQELRGLGQLTSYLRDITR